MASLKEVQLKIVSVKKTKQITKAMNMVATSRLRGAQTTMEAFRPYAEKFSEVLGNIADKVDKYDIHYFNGYSFYRNFSIKSQTRKTFYIMTRCWKT